MADVLKYGDKVHLQNGWDNWNGGFLDTNSGDPNAGGSKYGVSTAPTSARATGTGTWEITSASGKAIGAEVITGDVVYLRNLYGGDGGYLDTNSSGNPGSKFGVSTSPGKDRAPGSGRWRVFAETSSPIDSKVREADRVHLLNGWDNWSGGFLDTNGGDANAAGSKYGVSTSDYTDRAAGSGTWRFAKAKA
ncbi:hypothetical protein F0L68_12780 [Solihabitans fulvus]|uniref:Uncharacterized protein n=1 Tax=Solihabitans fulvus TaxID=1892852 RepID=A0A5B2XH44_9PSEU|nr:hypothetical protein [Solihabitans fulvus]KAA2262170.1 hypothetical protein F0L68_12780 [Solihabitans fulvus]